MAAAQHHVPDHAGVVTRMRGPIGFALLLLFLLGCFGPIGSASAQDEPAKPGVDRIEQLKELDKESAGSLAPTVISPDVLGEDGAAALKQSLKAYYDYRTTGYQHRQHVFEWQLLSSRIIFVLVIFLVLIGVYFSWLQFRSSLKGAAGEQLKETTFEASTAGFKVSSPVLGVIILAISLAFFYLYLVYIYPISEIV
jgi:hypothetical protein